MILSDRHMHTSFCDGKAEPEEYVESAIAKGLTSIGFSVHSYVPFDLECCIALERIDEYRARIGELKRKYADRIEILCGVEQDYYSEAPTDIYDYVIGSYHYYKTPDGEYLPLDLSFKTLEDITKCYFDGDFLSLCEDYYRTVADIPRKFDVDIIGHIDLITKFNERNPAIDTNNPRYIAAYETAVKALVPYGIPFEINTGAITRKYRKLPYPSDDILRCIVECGGKLTLSSDAHHPDHIAYGFEECEAWARSLGAELV